MIVSKGQAPVAVPNVVSLNVDQARAALAKAGLTMQVGQTAASDNIPPNTIASQDPKDGTQVDPGSAVTVSVSSGPGLGDVPDVTGKNMSDATAAVRAAGFEVSFSWRVVAGADGSVIQQTRPPAEGAQGLGDHDRHRRPRHGPRRVEHDPGRREDRADQRRLRDREHRPDAGRQRGHGRAHRTGSRHAAAPGDNNAVTIYFNQSKSAMRILGIDPGLRITGYGAIAIDGRALRLIEAGVVEPRRPIRSNAASPTCTRRSRGSSRPCSPTASSSRNCGRRIAIPRPRC